MHKTKLIQILLPLYNNKKRPFKETHYSDVKNELTEKFGGLTSFTRSPATGLWKKQDTIEHDMIIIYEVMTDRVDGHYWTKYKKSLEERFEQDELVIRCSDIELM